MACALWGCVFWGFGEFRLPRIAQLKPFWRCRHARDLALPPAASPANPSNGAPPLFVIKRTQVEMLRPGLLGTYDSYGERYCTDLRTVAAGGAAAGGAAAMMDPYRLV